MVNGHCCCRAQGRTLTNYNPATRTGAPGMDRFRWDSGSIYGGSGLGHTQRDRPLSWPWIHGSAKSVRSAHARRTKTTEQVQFRRHGSVRYTADILNLQIHYPIMKQKCCVASEIVLECSYRGMPHPGSRGDILKSTAEGPSCAHVHLAEAFRSFLQPL